jgi:hypothetical protein
LQLNEDAEVDKWRVYIWLDQFYLSSNYYNLSLVLFFLFVVVSDHFFILVIIDCCSFGTCHVKLIFENFTTTHMHACLSCL